MDNEQLKSEVQRLLDEQGGAGEGFVDSTCIPTSRCAGSYGCGPLCTVPALSPEGVGTALATAVVARAGYLLKRRADRKKAADPPGDPNDGTRADAVAPTGDPNDGTEAERGD